MSWLDKVNSDLIITTGDGKKYRPLWKPTGKGIEFFFTEFNFHEVAGSLVKRQEPKGRRFPMEFYFQGEDHLEQYQEFEISAIDKRAWVISHPYYNSITVQPVSLDVDHSDYNVSKITGVLIETITEDKPKLTVNPLDKIVADKEALDNALLAGFDVSPSAANVSKMADTNNKLYNSGRKLVLAEESESYFNAFNVAESAVNNAISEPLQAMRTVQAIINAPALFKTSVESRVSLFKDQFETLRTTLATITTRAGKKIFENQGATLVSSVAIASVNPVSGDYQNRSAVVRIVDSLLEVYNQFIEDLNDLQTANGGSIDSYIPDAESISRLSDMIKFTLSRLFEISLGAKQERSVILGEDSNVILLAHRYLGLKEDDSTILEFMETNNIGLSEILQIRKGRKIVYSV